MLKEQDFKVRLKAQPVLLIFNIAESSLVFVVASDKTGIISEKALFADFLLPISP